MHQVRTKIEHSGYLITIAMELTYAKLTDALYRIYKTPVKARSRGYMRIITCVKAGMIH